LGDDLRRARVRGVSERGIRDVTGRGEENIEKEVFGGTRGYKKCTAVGRCIGTVLGVGWTSSMDVVRLGWSYIRGSEVTNG